MKIIGNFNTEADGTMELCKKKVQAVGDSITGADVAIELCKKVQAEEYVIRVVVGSTNFYTRLQFFLLDSSWFPRPLGVCLWSALHVLLVFYEVLMLLVFCSIIFVLAIWVDALLVYIWTIMVLALPVAAIMFFIILSIACLWLVITCKCCTMPGRAPGQNLANYIFTAAFDTVHDMPQVPQAVEGAPRVVVEGPVHESLLEILGEQLATPVLVNHVILVSYPYRRAQLGDLCREIVPWYDTIVI